MEPNRGAVLRLKVLRAFANRTSGALVTNRANDAWDGHPPVHGHLQHLSTGCDANLRERVMQHAG